jgi:hypothetical protein
MHRTMQWRRALKMIQLCFVLGVFFFEEIGWDFRELELLWKFINLDFINLILGKRSDKK